MLKRRGNMINILITLSFLFTMILPGMAFASDSAEFTWSTLQGVETDNNAAQDLGFVKITDIEECDALYVEVDLPADVDFYNSPAAGAGLVNYINSNGSENTANWISGDADEYVVWFDADDVTADDDYIKLLFSGAADVLVKSGAPDDIYATITVKGVEDGIQVWSLTEECLIGVQGDTEITVDVDDATSISAGDEQEIAEITFSENLAGAFAEDDEIILTLPSGFKWEDPADYDIDEGSYGLEVHMDVNSDGDELTITIDDTSEIFADDFSFTAFITVYPNASEGDLEVDAEADLDTANFDDCSIVVAYIGESDGIITVEDDQDDHVFIGQVGAPADTFTIKTTGGPFKAGDDIILTLAGGAIWGIQSDEDLSNDWGEVGAALASEELDCIGFYNGNASIWLQVPDGQSYDEIEFTDMPLLVLPYYMGTDITVSLCGTYESDEPVAVASAIVHAELAAEKKAVEISSVNQAAGDITITEAEKDAFASLLGDDGSNFIYLELPTGVYFSDQPTIKLNGEEADVTLYRSYDYNFNDHEGDGLGATDLSTRPDINIMLGTPGYGYDEDFSAGSDTLFINFDNAGSDLRDNKIDTITISDIAYDFDTRYRATGDVTVKVGGRLLNDWLSVSTASGQEQVKASMYSVINAIAADADSASSEFVIGASTYNVNGVEYTMDVAPYISGDRTYLPVRFAAYALGISDANILWNPDYQTVTLMKGNKVAQLKAGSTELLINGAAVTMDAAPEITNDRVCLPIRFVAQAFGAIVGWDEATQTVSIDM